MRPSKPVHFDPLPGEARADHSQDVGQDRIGERLVADLRKRGRTDGGTPGHRELASMIVDEYVRFPEPRREEA